MLSLNSAVAATEVGGGVTSHWIRRLSTSKLLGEFKGRLRAVRWVMHRAAH